MEVENQEQAVEQVQGEPTTELSLEERVAEIESKYKAQIKGLDQKVSKLSKEKEALELEKMSESERAEAERKAVLAEAEAIKAETELLRRERDLTKVLYDHNLDPEVFSKRITGENLDEMKADAEKLTKQINAEVEKRLKSEIKERLGGPTPQGGEANPPMTYSEQLARAKLLSEGRKI